MDQQLQAKFAQHQVLLGTLAVNYPAAAVSVLAPSAREVELSGIEPKRELADWKQRHLDAYLASIDAGTAAAVSEVKSEVLNCPSSLLVLAGFSQGAMVVHRAELELAATDPSALAHVAGTILLADGDRTPHTAAAHKLGDAGTEGEGVAVRLGLVKPRDVPLPKTTVVVCNAHDFVCDFSVHLKTFVEGIRVHQGYREGDLPGEAGDWIAQELLRNHPGL